MGARPLVSPTRRGLDTCAMEKKRLLYLVVVCLLSLVLGLTSHDQ